METSLKAQKDDDARRIRLERRWWHGLPMWAFYAPVICFIALLMLRHRSMSAPFSANHGLPHGGLHPASKDEFAMLFAPSSTLLPRHGVLHANLSASEALAHYHDLANQAATYDFVLKPDDGIQGKSVYRVAEADAFVETWCKAAKESRADGRWLLQEYVAGVEVGLFYWRDSPDMPGRIVSMTLKHGFEVVGDGQRSIGDLIAGTHADKGTKTRIRKFNAERLQQVPEAGEILDLMPVRNHHLGATFEDISDQITPDLSKRIASELDQIDGFCFGRLDARAPDMEQLLKGQGIKVLEANALYSEPVHAYDPRYGFLKAQAIFMAYWAKAFEIGLANRRVGVRKMGFWQAVLKR